MGLGIFRSRLPSGGAGLVPKVYSIQEFVADSNGVDDTTTSTVTLLHNLDSVTLMNPFENTKANFIKKTVTQTKTKFLGATTKVETGTKEDKFALAPGETKSVALEEGHATVVWSGTEVNQDIYISLVSVDVMNEEGQSETQFTAAGRNLFGFDLQRTLTNYRNNKWITRGRGGKAVIVGLRLPLARLPRTPRSGPAFPGFPAAPGGTGEASYGFVDRIRVY